MSRFSVILAVLLSFSLALWAKAPASRAPSFESTPKSVSAPVPSNQPPVVDAAAGILIDRTTGVVLWAHNPDLELPMASTTKIMTAMVILDHGATRLNDAVRVSKNAASAGGSYIFHEGDVTTLYNLLIAALVRSSNEATVAAAEYLAGDEQTFVGWMNEKASRELGLTHTHFINPHGLYDRVHGAEHHTTARELAIIARYALTNYPLIRQIIVMEPAKIEVQPYKWAIPLENHDKIINQPVPGVPGAVVDGVKTGYVAASGRCLVSSATCRGWQLIAVVLNCQDDFQQNLALLHYGFTHYAWKTYASETLAGTRAGVLWGAPGHVPLGASAVLGAPLPVAAAALQDKVSFVGKGLRAPIRKGEQVGVLTLRRNGQVISTAPAIALSDAPVAWWARMLVGVAYLVVFFICFVVLDKVYGTRAKIARRRRRRIAAPRRKTDYGGASDY